MYLHIDTQADSSTMTCHYSETMHSTEITPSCDTGLDCRMSALDEEAEYSAHSFSTVTTTSSDDTCSTSHTNRATKRQVIFKETVRCIKIPSARNLSRDERAAVWMTPKEFNRINKQCSRVIEIMESNPEKYRSRGLESYTGQGAIAKNLSRSSAIQAVLLEQSRGSSSEAIAAAYRVTSSVSELRAYAFGLRDQRDAKNVIC